MFIAPLNPVKCSRFFNSLFRHYKRNMSTNYEKLHLEDSTYIAYHRFIPNVGSEGNYNSKYGIIFCQGLMSNMEGRKALALEKICKERSIPYVRFDYQGHGKSYGKFEDFSIGLWKRNTLAVLDKLTVGPQIIVGSSIGAWVMLLSALSAPRRIHGLVGIASAVDFLYQRYEALDLDQKALVEKQGYFPLPSDYSDEPYKIPFPTIKEASEHILLSKPSIEIDCPVRLIHGMNDNVVPYQLSISVAEKLRSVDVRVNLVKNGDHRMSTQEDLRLLERVLDDILQ